MRTTVLTEQAPAPIGPYSQGIRSGDLIFTAGQIGMLPNGNVVEGGVSEQTRQAILNIKAILEAAGSSLDAVVKTTIFLQDLGDFATVNAIYTEFFSGAAPARSTVQVARLPKDALVEIEAIAVAG